MRNFATCVSTVSKKEAIHKLSQHTYHARWVKIHVLQSLWITSIFSNKIYRHNKNV